MANVVYPDEIVGLSTQLECIWLLRISPIVIPLFVRDPIGFEKFTLTRYDLSFSRIVETAYPERFPFKDRVTPLSSFLTRIY